MSWKQPIPVKIPQLQNDPFGQTLFQVILLRCRKEDGEVQRPDGSVISLKRGQCIVGRYELAKCFGLKTNTDTGKHNKKATRDESLRVERKLRKLEKTNKLITKQKDKDCSVITVRNYDYWVSFEQSSEQSVNTNHIVRSKDYYNYPTDEYSSKKSHKEILAETGKGEEEKSESSGHRLSGQSLSGSVSGKNHDSNSPKAKTSVEVIFRSMLNKIKPEVKQFVFRMNVEVRKHEKGKYVLYSENIDLAIRAIIWYINYYQFILGIEHPRYRKPQLIDCLRGILSTMGEIEEIEEITQENELDIITEAITHWFATTSQDPNNLRLSKFTGKDSDIFYNSVMAVLGIM